MSTYTTMTRYIVGRNAKETSMVVKEVLTHLNLNVRVGFRHGEVLVDSAVPASYVKKIILSNHTTN